MLIEELLVVLNNIYIYIYVIMFSKKVVYMLVEEVLVLGYRGC